MLVFCGLTCDTCPISLATLEIDKTKQKELRMSNAKECQDKYNMDISYEEITDCDGCKSETERIFSGCGNCKIRIYAKDKKLENCAYCSGFPCSDLEHLFLYEAAAKLELEKIRSNMFFLK